MSDLKYPIGKFSIQETYHKSEIIAFIKIIESFPENLEQELAPLSDSQLELKYRPDGWTIRQVVHHCADSHLNSISRFKLALTEDNPIIRPYIMKIDGHNWLICQVR